ncbi:MAG: PKD domain-containing protein [Candidatus Polarisedimenticolia bacterium]
MAGRARPLALLFVILVPATSVFGVCNESVMPIFQCGYQGWFTPPPVGSGAVSAVWWQIGYGNLTHNSPAQAALVHEGTGYVGGEGFTGNDSGLFPVTMTDADAALAPWASQIPDGSICSDYQNSWGSAALDPNVPGGLRFVDGCADNARTSQAADDDNLLNPYWGAAYGPCGSDNCPYETLNYQVDYPLAFMLRESTSRFFALAFVASRSRNGDSRDVSEGVFDLGAIVNGEPNPVTGLDSAIPWQPVPWPRVDTSTDNGATLTLALSWDNIRVVHDGSIRPSPRVEAGGVGVLDHLVQPGGLCRYQVQTAPATVSNPEPSALSWVDAGAAIDCPPAPGAVTTTLTVDHDTAIRVRTLLGKRPRTTSTLLEDVRLGAAGDLGFEATACMANDCLASPPLLIVGNAPMNQSPVVHAGDDQAVDHPATVTLDATVLDDGLPPPPALTTLWSMESGPGVVTFGAPSQVDTTASFSHPGTYVLKLTASDGQLAASDTLSVVVQGNQRPVVDAGFDQTVTLPSEAILNGTVTDDGMPAGGTLITQWSVDSGPGIVFFGSQVEVDTAAGFTVAGTYVLRLSANDGQLTASDTVTITVNPYQINGGPVVSAGPDQDVFLPPGVVELDGTVTDDGLPVGGTLSVIWSKHSGPGEVSFSNVLSADTTATFTIPGQYVLRLSASDGQLPGSDVVTVFVDSSNQAPHVDAGPDQNIELPSLAPLHGSVTDDGLPEPPSVVTAWSVDSGPGTVVFGNAAALETTAHFTVAGTYVLRLTAHDGWQGAADTLSVQVTYPQVNFVAESRVALGTDDAEEKSVTGGISLTSGDLEMVQEAEIQTVGLRFGHLPIPRSATILRAWVQFTMREKQSEETTLVLRAQASDSAPTFTPTRWSISTRPVTLASVSWTPPPWAIWGEAGAGQRTPDIAPLLQEVVNRPGWSEGNALALIITGAGHRTAMSYEGSAASAALLHVEVAEILVNRPPEVDAGVDLTIRFPEGADLNATVTDDGLPIPPGSVEVEWSQVDGPDGTSFLDPRRVDTRIEFSVPGRYELRLMADDGELQTSDFVVVNVREPAPALVTLDVPMAAGFDDVEEKATGTMYIDSSDIELVQDTTTQKVGLRFGGLSIPPGATIRGAWIQFQADEMNAEPTTLAIHGQASDDASPFTAVKHDVSSRTPTTAWVPWSPVPWMVLGEAGPPQRTPDLSGIVQEIVNRPGWVGGGAMVFVISGSGHRTAEAFESSPVSAPRLHVEYE